MNISNTPFKLKNKFIGKSMQDVLTPLVAHQHWTCCVSGAVVSFPAGKQVVPEHCWALEDTHIVSRSHTEGSFSFKKQTKKQKTKAKTHWTVPVLPSWAKLLHRHLGTLWLHLLLRHSSVTGTRGKPVQSVSVTPSHYVRPAWCIKWRTRV